MGPVSFLKILETRALDNNLSVDNPFRVRLNQSLWQKITHFKEKSKLDRAVNQDVFSFFQERYGFKKGETPAFKRIWDKLGAKVWTPKDTLTVGVIRQIDSKFRKEMIYHGDGIKKPESLPETKPVDNAVQKIVQALLHGGNFSPGMVERSVAKAIFIEHSEAFMGQFHDELQLELTHLANNPPKNEQEEIVWRGFLGNVIALLPFSYPKDGETFTIPILEEGVCHPVKYSAEILPLEYSGFSTPMPALGLTSKEYPNAPPILSFLGTTFPAGRGFAASVLADFTPGHSVGEIIYKRNEEKISDWLKDKENVHVVGMSLGGAMAFHTVRNHQDIAKVDVYNPPGLYEQNWNHTKGVGKNCKVCIYCQPGDIVSKLGTWPTDENVSLYTVYSHQENITEGPISSHARAFTGCDRITIIKEDPEKKNRSFGRYLLTKMHQYLGPFAVYLPVSCMMFFHRIIKSVHDAAQYCFKKLKKHP